MTTWQLIRYPGVAVVINIYGHVMLLALAYTAGEYQYSPEDVHKLNPCDSIASFLVYEGERRWIWLLSAENISLSGWGRTFSGPVDTPRFPATSTSCRDRRRFAALLSRLADIFCPSTIV
jgi:hypothetical protein